MSRLLNIKFLFIIVTSIHFVFVTVLFLVTHIFLLLTVLGDGS